MYNFVYKCINIILQNIQKLDITSFKIRYNTTNFNLYNHLKLQKYQLVPNMISNTILDETPSIKHVWIEKSRWKNVKLFIKHISISFHRDMTQSLVHVKSFLFSIYFNHYQTLPVILVCFNIFLSLWTVIILCSDLTWEKKITHRTSQFFMLSN